MNTELLPGRHAARGVSLLFAVLSLISIGPALGLAQQGKTATPADTAGDAVMPSAADVLRGFDQLLAAADAGNTNASAQFGEFYEAVYWRAFFETSFDTAEKHASRILLQIDARLLQRATSGSPAAQYWMAARGKFMREYVDDAKLQEAVRWYRLSAEQGFPPAELALGEVLIFFDEFEREPAEAELWLYRAALHDYERADVILLNRLRQRAADGHPLRDEVMVWVEARAAAGDGEAQAVLEIIRRKAR